ncbi:hypothetical protein EZV73_01460 [Acidaminobacter sp. JC074]|uniref:hypothetical protein n=1 Tax=Acidaminobacter sp. JC074 TaxID=2530199 RepID=UPI001F0E1278|nr:hypothetical protein [Acidaminobacter sp. JC074]MCH4886211.1 hypothetical protein [Acidaminobacter sp. JC074]
MSKRKNMLILFSFLYIMVIVAFTVNSFKVSAKPYHKVYEGGLYRESDHTYFEKSSITFDGMLSNPLIGKSRFIGRITYLERDYDVDISFKDGEGDYITDIKNYTGANSNLGILYADEDLEKVTILIFEYNDMYIESWNARTGLILSGEAHDREMARSITRKNLEKSIYNVN